MKLAKLSLAAIMTVGALSTVNAGSLEESIKGVDISGFGRYRFYDESADHLQKKTDRHRFSASSSLTIPVADNLTAGATVEFEGSDYAQNAGISKDSGLYGTKLWFKYATDAYSVKAGKFEINTPLTDPGYRGNRGDGVLAAYTGLENWTFAGAAFVATNIGVSLGGSQIANVLYNGTDGADVGPFAPDFDENTGYSYAADVSEENLYALAAIGALGPVNVQAWAFKQDHVIENAFFVQADAKMAGFDVKAQYDTVDLEADLDNGDFYGIQAGYGMDNFHIGAGYTKTGDEDVAITTLSADGSLIKAGKQIYYEFNNLADVESMFLTADASYDKFGFAAGYVASSIDDFDGDEYYAVISYDYSKNFKTNLQYSDMSLDDIEISNDGTNYELDGDNQELRFEAKYSF